MRNSFNMLLIALALFDTCYNAASLMETVRKCFGAASRLEKDLRLFESSTPIQNWQYTQYDYCGICQVGKYEPFILVQ